MYTTTEHGMGHLFCVPPSFVLTDNKSGAVNTQGFVWKFFMCYVYKFSFIYELYHELYLLSKQTAY